MSERSAPILERLWRRARARRSERGFHWPEGIVSFSFDDFPCTALTEGGAILERHRARGTYYASMGLLGSDGALGPLFELDDLRRAHAFGHEIGCHTFTHLNCAEVTKDVLVEESTRNTAALSRALGVAPSSFAFPFGAASEHARRVLRPRYASCRGIQPGLNRSPADLAELKANKIYDREYDAARIHVLVEEARETGTWLIFYTHDVREDPSPWGCRPHQLEDAVAYAAERCKVLTVGEVLRGGLRPELRSPL